VSGSSRDAWRLFQIAFPRQGMGSQRYALSIILKTIISAAALTITIVLPDTWIIIAAIACLYLLGLVLHTFVVDRVNLAAEAAWLKYTWVYHSMSWIWRHL
jgi:hypothetical protein